MTTHRSAAQTKLEAVAVAMYAHVHAGAAWSHRPLGNGLEIVLQHRRDGQWRLALGRDGVLPNDVEVDAVRAAFGVPVEVEPVRSQRPRVMPKTGRLTTYHVVELWWIEREKVAA